MYIVAGDIAMSFWERALGNRYMACLATDIWDKHRRFERFGIGQKGHAVYDQQSQAPTTHSQPLGSKMTVDAPA
jgi:hypothetical protein